MAIIGAGIIGAGALLFMGQPSTSQAGGAFGGGGESKKETVTTETTTPEAPGEPIYNIVFPEPNFPAIPQANAEVPWWVTSLDPPAENTVLTTKTTKKGYYSRGGKLRSAETNKLIPGQFGPGKPRGWSMGVNLEDPTSKKVTAPPLPLPRSLRGTPLRKQILALNLGR